MGKEKKGLLKKFFEAKEQAKQAKKLEIIKDNIKNLLTPKQEVDEDGNMYMEEPSFPAYYKEIVGNQYSDYDEDGDYFYKQIRKDNATQCLHEKLWVNNPEYKTIPTGLPVAARVVALLWMAEEIAEKRNTAITEYEFVIEGIEKEFILPALEAGGKKRMNISHLEFLYTIPHFYLQQMVAENEGLDQEIKIEKYYQSNFDENLEKDINLLLLENYDYSIDEPKINYEQIMNGEANEQEEFEFALCYNQPVYLFTKGIFKIIKDEGEQAERMMNGEKDQMFREYIENLDNFYQTAEKTFKKHFPNYTPEEYFDTMYEKIYNKYENINDLKGSGGTIEVEL